MRSADVPLLADQQTGTVADRRAAGSAPRTRATRASHTEWSPASDRPEPVSLVEEQNRTWFAHLVPLKKGTVSYQSSPGRITWKGAYRFCAFD